MRFIVTVSIFLFSLIITSAHADNNASFQVLDFSAQGVSADGQVVYGSSNNQACIWTETGGIQLLPPLLSGNFFNPIATSCSADGSIVLGSYSIGAVPLGRTFRWTNKSGTTWIFDPLLELPPCGLFNPYNGTGHMTNPTISDDGLTIAGTGDLDSTAARFGEAFRLVDCTLVPIPDVTGFGSWQFDTSADGSVSVGLAGGALGYVRWDGDTPTPLQGLEGSSGSVLVHAVSGDGNFAIGKAQTPEGPWVSCRWDSTGEPQSLGSVFVTPLFNDEALDVNSDGTIVVGAASTSGFGLAFVWTEAARMQSISEILQDHFGVDLQGHELDEAQSISADGTVIIGIGSPPTGPAIFWRVVLPYVPVPCNADLDPDDIVDVFDLLLLLAGWGDTTGDVNGDGTTNVFDLLDLLAAWGPC